MSLTMPEFRAVTADQVLAFRQAQLWPDKPLTHVMIKGDDVALHIGAFEGDELVGVGSFFTTPTGAQLRKLAVAPAFRGKGVGRALLSYAAAHLEQQSVTAIWCDARQSAKGFYEKLGFEVQGPIFMKSGIPYLKAAVLVSSLRQSPPCPQV